MPDEDQPDFSVEAILAAHGRKVEPNRGPGRHAWPDRPPVSPGNHRLEENDLEERTHPAPVSWWRKWLADYGLIPPVTASR